MLLFDTAVLERRERMDAVSASMLDATLSTDLVHHEPDDVWLRIAAVGVGAVELVHVNTSGMDTRRTSRQVSDDEIPTIALSLGMRPQSVIEQDGMEIPGSPRSLNLVELTRPYRSRIIRGTVGWSAKIPLAELALPAGTIRRARRGISTSPVHGVFAQHVRSLGTRAGHLEGGLSNDLLGTATVALARALIASAADEDRVSREAMADTLLLRVQAYVRAHLSDPGLTPETIAAAHHVSVRHLYKTFAAADLRLEQWIIALRLEAARQELAAPEGRKRTIAGVARRWCFPNASHFSHRFREAYGMTPRDWRALRTAPR